MNRTDESRVALDLSWPDLDHRIVAMAGNIGGDGAPTVVVGVLRGGMVPAVMLAHRLGVRDVRGITVSRTLGDGPGAGKNARPELVNPASLGTFAGDADVLLVDDVAGSGASLAAAAGLVPGGVARVRRAVVVVNTVNWAAANTVAPQHIYDYVGTTCAGWVRFPWEVR